MLLLRRLTPTIVPSFLARRGLRAAPSALILNRAPIVMGAPDKRLRLWFEYRDSTRRCLFFGAESPFADFSLIRWALAIACSECWETHEQKRNRQKEKSTHVKHER
jgi:hypothetical protein